jgi:hypothetical protein
MTRLERARQEVVRLFDIELGFSRRLEAKQAELVQVTGPTAGSALLAAALEPPPAPPEPGQGDVTAPPVDRVVETMAGTSAALTRIEGEIRSLDAAIAAARRARVAAIEQVWKHEAEQARDKAGQLRVQVAAIDAKGEPHLRALAVLYQCAFVPEATVAAALFAAGVRVSGPAPGRPKTAAWLEEAHGLEQQARRLQTQCVRLDGALSASGDVRSVVAALAASPMVMGPSAARPVRMGGEGRYGGGEGLAISRY